MSDNEVLSNGSFHVENLVVGIGNILFKDDGFGSKVIEELNDKFKNNMPDEVMFVDGGTGATFYIFSLPDDYWKKVIVVDVVDFGAKPGTVRLFSPYDMPAGKYENAHAGPVEPLQEIAKFCDVVIVGCQPKEISTPYVEMGLTEPVKAAIPEAIDYILKEIGVL